LSRRLASAVQITVNGGEGLLHALRSLLMVMAEAADADNNQYEHGDRTGDSAQLQR
jgi:hypothetical protein